MFTTPCFIRKNTPELSKKLRELGYREFDTTNLENPDIKYLCADKGLCFTINPGCELEYVMDCGTNESLFLAIAALRDDSDKDQYFTDGIRWFKCPYERVEECRKNAGNYGNKLIDYSTKATVKELIEYFKN